MAQFDDILQAIERAINRFNRRIPATQKTMLDLIEEDLRDLDLTNGKIVPSVRNLSLIARIKNRMIKIILTDDYKAEVKNFAVAFKDITVLQNQYWKQVESTFKPSPLLKEIRNLSISDTVSKLLDSGIAANVSDPIADILRTNITTGGTYRQLADQLRESLTSTETPGTLEKYVKQISVDSINTYSRQYTQTVSSDLGFEWFKYSGSEIETSRPFCQAMVEEKIYFHVSEIPALLRAEDLYYTDNKDRQRKKVPIYAKTGLPHGFKPETNASNFLVNLAGYQCGHAARPISEGLVPKENRDKVYTTVAYQRWRNQRA